MSNVVLKNLVKSYDGNKNIINEWFELDKSDVNDFLNICEKYNTILNSLQNNPFFNKQKE